MNQTEVPTGITRAEQETVIQWDEEAKSVVIWSSSPPVLRKLARAGLSHSWETRKSDGRLHGKQFVVPLADFIWRIKKQRVMSEAQRQRMRERGFSLRKARKLLSAEPTTPTT